MVSFKSCQSAQTRELASMRNASGNIYSVYHYTIRATLLATRPIYIVNENFTWYSRANVSLQLDDPPVGRDALLARETI